MIVRRLDKNTYDVFGGTGWDQWTRLRRFHWGCKPIAGTFLPRPVLKDVISAIEANPNGSVENV